MRRVLSSIVAGTILVLALMMFVNTSAAMKPDQPGAGLSQLRTVGREVKAPLQPDEVLQPEPPDRNISLRGTVESLSSVPPYTGTWNIALESGDVISIEVTERTMILPPGVAPEVGDSVHVLARNEGSGGEETLVALKITVEKAQHRRGRPYHFRGQIEALPSDPLNGLWQVAGTSVTVDAETMIHPPGRPPTLGMVANVLALERDDYLWAMNITLQTPDEAASEVELEGTIEELPDDEDFIGTWVVDGISVTVTEDTDLTGATPVISLTAEVKGEEQDDGSILATDIKVEGPEHEEVEFEGALTFFTDTLPSVWVVDTDSATDTGEISVTVTLSTTIDDDKGPLEEGCWVEVTALQEPDGLVAIRIKVEDDPAAEDEVEFEGVIAALPDSASDYLGPWIIETEGISITVIVTPDTDIDGEPETGATAEVEGLLRADGFVQAESISIEEPPESEED